jgi:protoheme ferro-lyase
VRPTARTSWAWSPSAPSPPRADPRAQSQATAVADALTARGIPTTAYTGFTMTFPFVREALDQARTDGIDKLVVIYQGAQYSKVTAQILFRHVREYRAKHPEWDVDVVAIRSFSDDPRFYDLLKSRFDRSLNSFQGVSPDDVCIFLPMHGQVARLIQEGDPYEKEAMRIVNKVKEEYGSNRVSYGFQNHDEIPFIKWTKPGYILDAGMGFIYFHTYEYCQYNICTYKNT